MLEIRGVSCSRQFFRDPLFLRRNISEVQWHTVARDCRGHTRQLSINKKRPAGITWFGIGTILVVHNKHLAVAITAVLVATLYLSGRLLQVIVCSIIPTVEGSGLSSLRRFGSQLWVAVEIEGRIHGHPHKRNVTAWGIESFLRAFAAALFVDASSDRHRVVTFSEAVFCGEDPVRADDRTRAAADNDDILCLFVIGGDVMASPNGIGLWRYRAGDSNSNGAQNERNFL